MPVRQLQFASQRQQRRILLVVLSVWLLAPTPAARAQTVKKPIPADVRQPLDWHGGWIGVAKFEKEEDEQFVFIVVDSTQPEQPAVRLTFTQLEIVDQVVSNIAVTDSKLVVATGDGQLEMQIEAPGEQAANSVSGDVVIKVGNGESRNGRLVLDRHPLPDKLINPQIYQGTLRSHSGLHAALHVKLALVESQWVGFVTIERFGLEEFPLADIKREGSLLEASIPLGKRAAIKAEFDNDHNTLSGTLGQGSMQSAITLTRVTDATSTIDLPLMPEGTSSWMIRRHTNERWALVGGRIVNPQTGDVSEPSTVVISGDVIESISESVPTTGIRTFDIHGKFIIPGLFDLHAHIQPMNVGLQPESEEAAAILGALVDHGVTTARGLPLTSEYGIAAASLVNSGKLRGPTIIPCSGVFEKNPQRTSWGFGDPETAKQWVLTESAMGARWIKVYNSMDEECLKAIVESAHANGMFVCGHAVDVPPFEAASLGMDCIEHVISIPRSCLLENVQIPDNLGLAERTVWMWRHVDTTKASALMDHFQQNNTGWVLTLVVVEQMARDLSESETRNNTSPLASELAAVIERSASMAVSLHRTGGLVGIGTDFPINGVKPGESVHRELELLVTFGEATPAEALEIATASSAAILRMDGITGTIEAGKFADLVVLDANPIEDISNTRKIHSVIQRGKKHQPGSR